jgi:formiminotetrahydrofolate cyclodeaminase
VLGDRTLTELLAEIAAATPAPGGGSSAAVACAVAAALVEMSAGPPHERAAALRARALELADQDLDSYAPVLEAQRRGEPVGPALSAAAEVPLAIAEVACEVAELAHAARPSLEGDAAAAALLAEAATRAAVRLVELNLARRPDDPRLRTAREFAARAWSAREGAL